MSSSLSSPLSAPSSDEKGVGLSLCRDRSLLSLVPSMAATHRIITEWNQKRGQDLKTCKYLLTTPFWTRFFQIFKSSLVNKCKCINKQ